MGQAVRQAAKATVHLALGVALAAFSIGFITVLLITAVGTVAIVGAVLLPETVLLIRRMAGAKRSMTANWTGREIHEAYLPITGPLRGRLRTAILDPGTLTDVRWMVAHYAYGGLGFFAVPLWPAGLLTDGVWCGLLSRRPVVLPLITKLADLDAAWSAALLKPSPRARLTERVEQLTQTRAGAIAAHSAELRRIERDLHDGAQARLVSLSMRIGLAKRAYNRDPQAAWQLLEEAQEHAEAALAELRHVVRGIHPPILTDRGLAGAVRALAASSGIEVTVQADDFDEGPRAPAAVEAAAYFVVAEALTNAARHSGSGQAGVSLTRTGTGVRVVVGDDGKGGAVLSGDGTGGTGLAGMRRRVAALDGTFAVTSPVGGPTVIEAELPCVW
jgi:signal transduction histidine kinase